ncbi:MAG: hypothetical protein BMS9Abin31_0414 [Gammaproteobacteria bacterium]|nr:MAG: hypothetical protein BMS9Abin31_0414 [Gammaproteobacteria bacterium]
MNNTEYKLAHIDKNKISTAARKSLITADPLYHSWSQQKQEYYRATKNEVAQKNVRRVLLNDLLNSNCTNDNVDKLWGDIPIEELNILNWENLLTTGIGDDYIYLNESMAKDKSLLDFETLYDYDYADYLFQEQANKKEFSDYKSYEYYAYKHPSWVRLLIEDQFYYATFLSLATYLHDETDSFGQDYIDTLIPHEYINGKDHAKCEKGGFLWDMKLDASGLEGQLDELNHRWFNYLQQRWLTLSKELRNAPPSVYTEDKYWDNDPHRFFIFNNEETLKRIHWQHFISDCETLVADISTIKEQLEQEITSAKLFLSNNHQDIMNNFDPKVTRLRKKRKIIMSPEALDDLVKISNDEKPEK